MSLAPFLFRVVLKTEMRLLFETLFKTHRGVSSRLLGRPFEPVAESELHTAQEEDDDDTGNDDNGDAEEGEVRVLC
eukprot:COSAG06_NODE_56699_length_283_cov_1.119565_1_plen_75_part_10